MDVHDTVTLSLLAEGRRGMRRRLCEMIRHASGKLSFHETIDAAAREPVFPQAVHRARHEAEQALERARRSGMAPLVLGAADYPAALVPIADPPLVLWRRGRPDLWGESTERPAVAIVGARAATAYAREVAARFALELAEHGVLVVSGLARGVDVAAHLGALRSESPRPTVAVLGSGADVIYPPEHDAIAGQILERGAIVSELAPGTPPRPEHFPRRNRLVSGLSRAVVVVEASERSGALITADAALDQGREVLAVPGGVLTRRNRGGHQLLREGARLAEDVADILEELRLPGEKPARSAQDRAVHDPVLRCMERGEAYDLDELARACRLDPAALLPRLLDLELSGAVRRAGAQFVRSARTC